MVSLSKIRHLKRHSRCRRWRRTRSPECLSRKNHQMTKLRVESFTISIDGFGAGPDQTLENPLGIGGTALHGWAFATRTFQTQLFGAEGGETGIDDDFAARGFHNVAPGSWAGICSGPSAVPGWIILGKVGGAITRCIISRFSSSRIIPGLHSSWRAARPFIS